MANHKVTVRPHWNTQRWLFQKQDFGTFVLWLNIGVLTVNHKANCKVNLEAI